MTVKDNLTFCPTEVIPLTSGVKCHKHNYSQLHSDVTVSIVPLRPLERATNYLTQKIIFLQPIMGWNMSKHVLYVFYAVPYA